MSLHLNIPPNLKGRSGNMGLPKICHDRIHGIFVYLPLFTYSFTNLPYKINHPCIGKNAVPPMDPLEITFPKLQKNQLNRRLDLKLVGVQGEGGVPAEP